MYVNSQSGRRGDLRVPITVFMPAIRLRLRDMKRLVLEVAECQSKPESYKCG